MVFSWLLYVALEPSSYDGGQDGVNCGKSKSVEAFHQAIPRLEQSWNNQAALTGSPHPDGACAAPRLLLFRTIQFLPCRHPHE
jgi:hypothetical protein